MRSTFFVSPVHRGRIFTLCAAVGAVLLLSSCYPDYNLSPTDYDLVMTRYVPGTNFGAYNTYMMPDTVVHLDGDTLTGTNKLLSRKYDQTILSTVAARMSDLGYQRVAVDTTNPADVAVIVAASGSTTIYYNYWYPYWPGYGGWGGWYYPPTVSVGSYSTGTLYVNMLDPAQRDSQKRLPVVWFAAANGLLNATSTPATRLTEAINQAFTQSPYLKTN
jgi:hypothetical protein